MTSERLLQSCVASMAALATLMLGTSQDSIMLPVTAMVAAISSLIFTDFLGWFHLHRFVAGAAGVIAGINAFVQSQDGGLEIQFISAANLLIYLQIILLFQTKTHRIYWQLITLSLLQVVVAAALNLFFLFGPLLVLYMACTMSALLLFFINRETAPFLQRMPIASSDKEQIICVQSLGTAVAKHEHERRPRKELLKVGFLRHFTALSLSTVVASACVFLLMPRYGDGVWRAKTVAAKTGFSGEVNLEDSGSIYESPAFVMRVSFTDEGTGELYPISSELYFRGRVLRDYTIGSGRWRRGGGDLDIEIMKPLANPQRIYSAVRLTVNLERQRGGVVFGVAPVCGLEGTPTSITIDQETQEILYEPGKDDDPVQYSLGTFGLHNGLQSQYSPNFDSLLHFESQRNRVLEDLPELAAAASKIVVGIPSDDILAKARALESHFTGGLRYRYSLDPSSDRNPAIDPVVDFALNHRSGHCQHFASALALMLRSQGIPSRVVVGYHGGIFNVVGSYYQLREMDAHAWAEAAIPVDQIPHDEVLPTEGLHGDAWIRLDPTPSGDEVANRVGISPWRQWLSDSIDYTQLLWSEYVLGLNEKRQRKAIYEPILNTFRNFAAFAFSREIWAVRWELLRHRFRGDFFTQVNARDLMIAVAVLTVAFYGLRFMFHWLWQFATKWFSQGRQANRPSVEFYHRFESLLAKHGIRRELQQTPHEFALAAGKHIAGFTADPAIAAITTNVVDLFYRVRFGHDRLDTADILRLDNWLEILQKSLAGNCQ